MGCGGEALARWKNKGRRRGRGGRARPVIQAGFFGLSPFRGWPGASEGRREVAGRSAACESFLSTLNGLCDRENGIVSRSAVEEGLAPRLSGF